MNFLDILTFTAVLGSGLVAGIFFAFSTFVMRALPVSLRERGGSVSRRNPSSRAAYSQRTSRQAAG